MFIVIAGGGKVGSYLASVLLQSGNEVAVIEETLKTADQLSVMRLSRHSRRRLRLALPGGCGYQAGRRLRRDDGS